MLPSDTKTYNINFRDNTSLPLYEAKATCVEWRDELIEVNYDLDEWLKQRGKIS